MTSALALGATCRGNPLSSLTAIVARSTAATAGVGSDPAVQQDAIPSALRQLRQLRQGCLISCSRPLVGGMYWEKYVRRSRKTLPTQPSLPYASNIKGLRTAGCCHQPADPAVIPFRGDPRGRLNPRNVRHDHRTAGAGFCRQARRPDVGVTATEPTAPRAGDAGGEPCLLRSNSITPSHHCAPRRRPRAALSRCEVRHRRGGSISR